MAAGHRADRGRLLVLSGVAGVGLLRRLQVLEEEVGDEREDAWHEALGVFGGALLLLARLAAEDVAAVGHARQGPPPEGVGRLTVATDGDLGLVGQGDGLDQVGRDAGTCRVAERVRALELRARDRRGLTGDGEHGRIGRQPCLAGVRRPAGGDGDVADALRPGDTREDDSADPGLRAAREGVEGGPGRLVGVGRTDAGQGQDHVVAGQFAHPELPTVHLDRTGPVDPGRIEERTDLGGEGGDDEEPRHALGGTRLLGRRRPLGAEEGGGDQADDQGGCDRTRQAGGDP